MKVKGFVRIGNRVYHNQIADEGLKAVTTALMQAEPLLITHVFFMDIAPSSVENPSRYFTFADSGDYKGLYDFTTPNNFVTLNNGLSVSYGSTNSTTDYRSILMNITLSAGMGNVTNILNPVEATSTVKHGMFMVLNGDTTQVPVTTGSDVTNVYTPNGNEKLFSFIVFGTPVTKLNTAALSVQWQILFDNSSE